MSEIQAGAAVTRVSSQDGHLHSSASRLEALPAAVMSAFPPKGGYGLDSAAGSPSTGTARVSVPHDSGRTAASAPVEVICAQLVSLQRSRRFAIVSEGRSGRACEAFVRIHLGFQTDTAPRRKRNEILEPTEEQRRKREATERKRLSAEARALITAVNRGDAPQVPGLVVDIIQRSAAAAEPWSLMRADVEKQMRDLARQLPAYEFVSGVKGVGELGLAVVVAEAGDLGNYPKHGHLWKRLGLMAGQKGSPSPGLSREDRAAYYKDLGYSPTRRAETFAFFDDTMFRSQWAGDRDEDGKRPEKTGKPVATPAHALGPYGEAYGRKKAEYVERGHPWPDRAARRYMTKKFIRDLWRAWRKAATSVDHL